MGVPTLTALYQTVMTTDQKKSFHRSTGTIELLPKISAAMLHPTTSVETRECEGLTRIIGPWNLRIWAKNSTLEKTSGALRAYNTRPHELVSSAARTASPLATSPRPIRSIGFQWSAMYSLKSLDTSRTSVRAPACQNIQEAGETTRSLEKGKLGSSTKLNS